MLIYIVWKKEWQGHVTPLWKFVTDYIVSQREYVIVKQI